MQQIKGYDVTKKPSNSNSLPLGEGWGGEFKKQNKQPLTLLINQLPKAN
jgi:hypothetical protein